MGSWVGGLCVCVYQYRVLMICTTASPQNEMELVLKTVTAVLNRKLR